MGKVEKVEVGDMMNRGYGIPPWERKVYSDSLEGLADKEGCGACSDSRDSPDSSDYSDGSRSSGMQAADRRNAGESEVMVVKRVAGEEHRLRVCSYCRISTKMESQQTSIVNQEAHYEDYIRRHPEWTYAGTYIDVGVTGTKTEIRPELKRLIRDCQEGKIDLVLTKSISRFARNTSDCLELVRLLNSLGVDIRFEKEQLGTDTMDSEFILTILAALAQDESHSISGNMKWGIRKRFEKGIYRQSVPPYGYEWRDGRLCVVPEQAEVVREIFDKVLRGAGAASIAEDLNRRNIISPGGKKWTQNTLRRMISNIAYVGDTLYQKSFRDDHFSRKENKGELDYYFEKDHHEAIISRDNFEAAGRVVRQRAKEVGYYVSSDPDESDHNRGNRRYCFSGSLICGKCGSVLHRQKWKDGRVGWICSGHRKGSGHCAMKPQSDIDIKAAFINCMNKLSWIQSCGSDQDRILDLYEKMISKNASFRYAERLIEIEIMLRENRQRMRELMALALQDHFLPEHRERKLLLELQEKKLQEEKTSLLKRQAAPAVFLSFKDYVNDWKITGCREDFPEDDYKEYVEQGVVFSGTKIVFEFRCGLRLTESLVQA